MKKVLIWSYQHNAWWRPNSCGYTSQLAHAGLYPEEEAKRICDRANRYEAAPQEVGRDPADYENKLLSDDWKEYLNKQALADGE